MFKKWFPSSPHIYMKRLSISFVITETKLKITVVYCCISTKMVKMKENNNDFWKEYEATVILMICMQEWSCNNHFGKQNIMPYKSNLISWYTLTRNEYIYSPKDTKVFRTTSF